MPDPIRRWVTEFTGLDQNRYAGPIILADCHDAALAFLSCLAGPNGQQLRLTGELILQVQDGEDTQSHVRRVS